MHAGILHIMIEKQSLSEELIINCLNSDYGIEVAKLMFLPIGTDMNASVYKAETYDRRSYFVKLKRGHHHDIDVEIVELSHAAGIRQIIPPIKTLLGQLIQCIEDLTLIVYPFVEGQVGIP
jgi:spectinomycin phosphotransferase